MTHPKITKTQEYILYLLYKFRFLNTHHFQKLLHHKNPKRTQSWLKDLRDKGYIQTLETKDRFTDRSIPLIYRLASKARFILKQNEDCDTAVLERIYKEHKRTESFIIHCLEIAEVYLFFVSQKEEDEEIHFFTQTELTQYDYFPDELPSAYIAVQTKDTTRRYFLEVFYDYAKSDVYRGVLYKYLSYADSDDWESNTENEPLPSVLFVCANERLKKHTAFYAKGRFQKEFEEKIDLFLTIKKKILQGNDKDVWERVEL